MKIIVAVKRVVDYNIKVRAKSDETDVDIASVKMSINPFDEIAVEEALRLREKGIATEVVTVSIGGPSSQETLRHTLALGADRSIHILTDNLLEPLNVAKLLTKVVCQEEAHLVILGKQAIDDDCNQVGQMMAGLLNWPQGTFASAVHVEGNQVTVTREVDGGLETVQLSLPALITTDLRLNTPRYATLPNIMKAKQKPLTTISATDFGIDLSPRLKSLKVCEPPTRKAGIKVETISLLATHIKGALS